MYQIFKTVINTTPFALSEMQKKINANWVQSYLSDEEREELLALAAEKADANNDLAPLQEQIDALWVAVHALQDGAYTEETNMEEFPEYVKPESKDQYYTYGDKVTYKGVQYIFVGAKNAGADPITYPYAVNADGTVRGWQKYSDYLAAQEAAQAEE